MFKKQLYIQLNKSCWIFRYGDYSEHRLRLFFTAFVTVLLKISRRFTILIILLIAFFRL